MIDGSASGPPQRLEQFADYVGLHGSALLRQAAVLTADPEAARDVVQAVLERAYHRWARIQAMDHPDAYLRRMVVNEVVSVGRRLSRIRLVERVPEAVAPDSSQALVDRHALIESLRRLPPRQRIAIALRYFEDLSDAQIADQLGCGEVSVRGYIWRGLRRLRVDLELPEDGLGSAELGGAP